MNATLKQVSRPALALLAFALAGTLCLALIDQLTRERIAANERQAILSQIHVLVDPRSHDNDPLADVLTLPAEVLHSADPVTVYRARRQQQPVAAVFITTAPDGYNGRIRLAVGLAADQTLTGVRTIAHKETPGLGDRIEAGRSDWILGFNGRALTNPPPAAWAVKKDGGQFDQFTGATITPRAVVNAVRAVLEWARNHPDQLFAPAGTSDS
ncbi:MAG: electron transport complex subunit RsxG [Thiothrix sp.]|nr:electron transport complex subunit RsxG [Thiothrix sp.]HPQ94566.1 electron transport complex subunit RsxG [Thiolinea sp.]